MDELVDLVGVLATDEEIINATGVSEKTSIYLPFSKVLHYHVKLLSDTKVDTYNGDKKYFLGYLNCIREYVENKSGVIEEEEKIDEFRNFMEKFVLIFHYMRPAAAAAPFCKIADMSIVKRPKQFNRNTAYHAVPIFEPHAMLEEWEDYNHFELRRNYKDVAGFLNKVISGKPLGRVLGFQKPEEVPDFILWRDEERVLAIGPFSGNNYQDAGYVLTSKHIQVYVLEDEIADQVLMVHTNPTIAHLPLPVYKAIESALDNKKGIEGNVFLDYIIEEKGYDLSEISEQQEMQKNEGRIIESIQYYCQERKMHFCTGDLINFHVAMKIDSLVILSGMSGIGKSSLAEIYAQAIGAEFLNVPVNPSWNDDSDLLGYYDMMHHVYCPSDNQFVSTLADAMRHPEKMYIICLDEMNLARVEHYFSQFLSVLEKKERRLYLYDPSLEESTGNREQYPSSVVLGDNIRFLGTVNIDETTYHFSDKVLDRANIIQLHVENYAIPYEEKYYISWTPLSWNSREYNEYYEKTVRQNYTLRRCLWEMHELFLDNGLSSGVGPRVVSKIEEYLENIPKLQEEEQLEIRDAIDLQVAQRILTKVRGREEQLMEIFNISEEQMEQKGLMDIFTRYQMLSDFEECKKIMNRKRRELKIYGYCV